MYDELVKRLRESCHNCKLWDGCECRLDGDCTGQGRLQAADAIEELSKPRWIPVTERLPEKYQWCLVVGDNLYDKDFINSRGVWAQHDKPYAPIDYWMPLPERPKEENA